MNSCKNASNNYKEHFAELFEINPKKILEDFLEELRGPQEFSEKLLQLPSRTLARVRSGIPGRAPARIHGGKIIQKNSQ